MRVLITEARLRAVLAVAVACASSSCGTFYPRYANGVPVVVDEETCEMQPYGRTSAAEGLRVQEVPVGGYVRFVVDKLCFAELPGVLTNQSSAWVGITAMSSDSRQESTLFSQFQAALGDRERSSEFLSSVGSPTLDTLLTNSNSCVDGMELRTPPVAIDGHDPRHRPRMFIAATVLFSREHQDVRDRVEHVRDTVGSLGTALGVDVSQYGSLVGDIVTAGAELLSVVSPDRVFLWSEASVPLGPGSDPGHVLVPASDQRFVWLFTGEVAQRVDGEGQAEANGCGRTQAEVTRLVESGQLTISQRGNVVRDRSERCRMNTAIPDGFGAPYLVWHVESVNNVSAGDSFWEIVTQVAQSAADGSRGAAYRDDLGALRSNLEGASGRLYSSEQRRFLNALTNTLEQSLSALGLVGTSGGSAEARCATAARLAPLLEPGSHGMDAAPLRAIEHLQETLGRGCTPTLDAEPAIGRRLGARQGSGANRRHACPLDEVAVGFAYPQTPEHNQGFEDLRLVCRRAEWTAAPGGRRALSRLHGSAQTDEDLDPRWPQTTCPTGWLTQLTVHHTDSWGWIRAIEGQCSAVYTSDTAAGEAELSYVALPDAGRVGAGWGASHTSDQGLIVGLQWAWPYWLSLSQIR